MKCPNCNKKWIAEILWGLPEYKQELEEKLERKEIVLGGCLVTDHDPKWECNICHHKWGQRNDYDTINNDSFDYDLGFNIDEVYDQ